MSIRPGATWAPSASITSAPSGALETAPTSRILSANRMAPSSTLFLAGLIRRALVISVGLVIPAALHRHVDRRRKRDGDDEGDPDWQVAQARRVERGGQVIVHAPPEQEHPH